MSICAIFSCETNEWNTAAGQSWVSWQQSTRTSRCTVWKQTVRQVERSDFCTQILTASINTSLLVSESSSALWALQQQRGVGGWAWWSQRSLPALVTPRLRDSTILCHWQGVLPPVPRSLRLPRAPRCCRCAPLGPCSGPAPPTAQPPLDPRSRVCTRAAL